MTIVNTSFGPVLGSESDGVYSFRGIPFAAPPVGHRRFRAATAPDPWSDPRDCTVPGPIAPQTVDPLDKELNTEEIRWSEADCLHLTVHSPNLSAKKPVFVWIHGGSFTSGSSSWRIYDTINFAASGIVGVGINYRLGAFGFADLRSHFGDSYPANIALTDAIQALTWIRENIEKFGGDPDRVTIAGESAGAGMVTALMASPLADGLYHRVILQSGLNFMVQEPEQSSRVAENLLQSIGVEPGDTDALEGVETGVLLEASEDRSTLLEGTHDLRLAWNMHHDPHSMPTTVYERLTSGALKDIDMLIGTTADENKLRFLVEEPPTEDFGDGLEAELSAKLRPVYRAAGRGDEEWEISEAIINDRSYLVPSTWGAEVHSRTGAPTFMYLFTWPSPVLGGRLGSCHALENGFVFHNLKHSPYFHGTNPPQELADKIHGAWVAFAATGSPQTDLLPEWPTFSEQRRAVMELGDTVQLLDAPRGAERNAWAGLPPQMFGVG